MDKTLDEVYTVSSTPRPSRSPSSVQIIATRPKGIRRTTNRRGSAKTQVLGSPTAPIAKARANAAANGTKTAAPTAAQPSDKIIVSNLPPDVNELQVKVCSALGSTLSLVPSHIQELFHTTVGPLRDVTLHYDSQGRSKGVAAVQFQRRGDGTKAFQQYNNRLIDGS